MSTSSQTAPATALVQLLTEHPELPQATWYLPAGSGTLHGHLIDTAFVSMHAYAELMGGSIRAGKRTFEDGEGRTLRTHWLTTTWRDVRIHLSVAVLVPSVDALMIEQRHQLVDPTVPVLPGACRTAVPA